jgi:hypothetical protein
MELVSDLFLSDIFMYFFTIQPKVGPWQDHAHLDVHK